MVQRALTLTTHTAGNARRTRCHYNRLATNSCDSESLLEEKQQELQQAEEKLLYKAVKRETHTIEYYKVAEIEKRLDHNPGQAKDNSRKTSGQHNAEANPRHTPVGTMELMEHRSNHVRPESHDTSTNIPDLHKVEKEQPGVTPRDTKQPSENDVSSPGMATLDLHKVEGPQAESPMHLGHATRSGNYTLRCHHRRHQGVGY
ncbi:hypothetical protein Taro_028709 [Colocasia esculenta]|uniref:Uncharacterized protein n=1 Tax=Colocasia esculenta TaxID=4460 RepID=A0A843VBZ0_COLES|nr:hypothetical protein [Colocasia esculenta]